jgi:hypothetical protein
MSTLLLILSAALSTPALAQEACDAGQLATDLKEASPQGAARAFTALASCDAAKAKAMAGSELPRVLSGMDGSEALVAAVEIGAIDAATAWTGALQSDERAGAIRALGDACSESEAIQAFFVERAETLGDEFWAQRWYRALAGCQAESVQALLSAQLDQGIGSERGRYFGVLETYARNAGAGAIDKLVEIAGHEEAEIQINAVQFFADAAQVGSMEGMDLETAGKAIDAINALAPSLTGKAIEQARITLTSLQDEASADALAGVRYKDRVQADGTFMWGAITVESATCKNGKPSQRFQVAKVIEGGQTWPDQLAERVQDAVDVNWDLDLATRCKGEGSTELIVPNSPFADKTAHRAWVDTMLEGKKDEAVKRVVRLDHDPLSI